MATNNETSWPETAAGMQLQKRLNEEKTVQALDRLLDRIEVLEQAVERLSVVMAQAPGLISMLTDTVDEQFRQAKQEGASLEDRIKGVLRLTDKLTAPATLEKLENMDKMLDFWDQAPGHMAMMVDMADEEMAKAMRSGVDFREIGDATRKMGMALSKAQRMESKAPSSIWGLLRALKDPDRQEALSFLLRFSKAFGQELKK
jgi:uncharacterized protein YjgD (DUF1641 family)